MPYKNSEKQRQAQRKWDQEHRPEHSRAFFEARAWATAQIRLIEIDLGVKHTRKERTELLRELVKSHLRGAALNNALKDVKPDEVL